jgi:pimeloyl-ACP methyl ester carboxylesterase
MKISTASASALVFALALACRAADAPPVPGWQVQHDQLVQRLRALAEKEGAFGPAYQPLYHAALPWYELWGGREQHAVDPDMVAPEAYADALAGALEQGRNFFAEHPGDLFPLVFQKTMPDGKTYNANYWITLPAGFPAEGRTFPLAVGLHGSGWLGHKISYKKTGGARGPMFTVTPIDEGGPWKIEFLNAYLDELERMLPIDRDRVYLSGHSLGAMATWEWALDNPERFAAIAPMAGIGEPYRASRLKHVPVWAIHGENDHVVPRGFEEQMVTALQACGGSVRYSVIKGGGHNMPVDLDWGQIDAWYLRQTRSPLRAPSDPRDALALNDSGFSPWAVVTVPETPSWKSGPVDLTNQEGALAAALPLFDRVHARGEIVDSLLRAEADPATRLATLWLAVPKTLHNAQPPDPSIVVLPETRFVRFYLKGSIQQGLDHMEAIRPGMVAAGHHPTGKVWITPLSIWHDSPTSIAEYAVQVD